MNGVDSRWEIPVELRDKTANPGWARFSTEQARVKLAKAYPKPTAKES